MNQTRHLDLIQQAMLREAQIHATDRQLGGFLPGGPTPKEVLWKPVKTAGKEFFGDLLKYVALAGLLYVALKGSQK